VLEGQRVHELRAPWQRRSRASVEGLTLGWLPLRGVFFVESAQLWAEIYLHRCPAGIECRMFVVFSAL